MEKFKFFFFSVFPVPVMFSKIKSMIGQWLEKSFPSYPNKNKNNNYAMGGL